MEVVEEVKYFRVMLGYVILGLYQDYLESLPEKIHKKAILAVTVVRHIRNSS